MDEKETSVTSRNVIRTSSSTHLGNSRKPSKTWSSLKRVIMSSRGHQKHNQRRAKTKERTTQHENISSPSEEQQPLTVHPQRSPRNGQSITQSKKKSTTSFPKLVSKQQGASQTVQVPTEFLERKLWYPQSQPMYGGDGGDERHQRPLLSGDAAFNESDYVEHRNMVYYPQGSFVNEGISVNHGQRMHDLSEAQARAGDTYFSRNGANIVPGQRGNLRIAPGEADVDRTENWTEISRHKNPEETEHYLPNEVHPLDCCDVEQHQEKYRKPNHDAGYPGRKDSVKNLGRKASGATDHKSSQEEFYSNHRRHHQRHGHREQNNSEKSPSPAPAIALIGNPGSGKSTILNGFAGKAVFEAGISLGCGLTSVLHKSQGDGYVLYDTPGLADIERKKQAGEELDKLLKKDICIKVAFVVTLERGRVRPEDALTIDLVLDAIKCETNNRFGIIVNQVTSRVQEQIDTNLENEVMLRKSLLGDRETSHWCYVALKDELVDGTNGMLMTPELKRFFRYLPETKPKGARTIPIDTESLEEKLEKQIALIREIEEINAEERHRLKEELLTQKKIQQEQESKLLAVEQSLRDKLDLVQAENAAIQAAAEKAAQGASYKSNQTATAQNNPSTQPHKRHNQNMQKGNKTRARAGAAAAIVAPAIVAPVAAEGLKIMHEYTFDQGQDNTGASPEMVDVKTPVMEDDRKNSDNLNEASQTPADSQDTSGGVQFDQYQDSGGQMSIAEFSSAFGDAAGYF